MDPATAAGASIAPYVGRALATPLVRRVQGMPLLLYGISDKNLQKRLREHMREHRYTKPSAKVDDSLAASEK